MIFWWSSDTPRGAWAAGFLILMVLGLLLTVFTGLRTPLAQLIIFIVPLFFFVLPFFRYVIQGGKKGQAQPSAANEEREKPKHGESLGELMSILNDEDIDDLRARVKARLAEQIDSADAAEMETFADLLAETKRKRR